MLTREHRTTTPPPSYSGARMAALLGGLLAAAVGSPAVGLLLAGGAGLGLVRQYRGRRRALRADDGGLTERRWLARDWHVPWEGVRGVRLEPDQAVIDTDRGELLLDGRDDGWREFAREVRSQARQQTDPRRELDSAQIDELLGLTPGAWLEVHSPGELQPARPSGWLLLELCAVSALLIGVLDWLIVSDRVPDAAVERVWLAVAVLGALYACLRWCRQWELAQLPQVHASAVGLRVRGPLGWRTLAWHDLTAVDGQAERFVFTLGGSDVQIPRAWPGATELAGAANAVLRARRRGLHLPRLGEVPANALSLARESGDEAAERGLSLSDNGGARLP